MLRYCLKNDHTVVQFELLLGRLKYLFFILQDKTVLCPVHAAALLSPGGSQLIEQHLRSLAVFRKVYVQRQETKQIASIMQQGELTQGKKF